MAQFVGSALPLSQQGLDQALGILGVGPAEVWTVVTVETKGFGFLADRRPRILFERHIFHRQTNGAYDASNPDVSAPSAGGYLGGAAEYDRLGQAMALDAHAALNSASWGVAQIMGFNSQVAGFATVEEMVAAMQDSEDAQLAAMARFLAAQGLGAALAGHDWTTFARVYNGPNYAVNAYDRKLGAAYQTLSQGPLPDLAVRQAQAWLTFLNLAPGGVDGVLGPRTRNAVQQFQQQNGLPVSGSVDDTLLAALRQRVNALSQSAVA